MRKTYTIESTLKEVNRILDEVFIDIKPYFNESDAKECLLGVYELMVNAIEHGNLGITYDMKKKWLDDDTYDQEFKALTEKFKDKKVVLSVLIEDDTLVATITDEGKGFDMKKQVEVQTEDNILRESGRGLIIVKHFFEVVVYNEVGNQVTIVKKLEMPPKA